MRKGREVIMNQRLDNRIRTRFEEEQRHFEDASFNATVMAFWS